MPSYRIVCVIKPNINSTVEDISKIGYYQTAYKPKVIIPIEEAVTRIEANPQEFYIRNGDKTVFAKVEKRADKNPFIITTPDKTNKDSLLSLE